ncbi:MAG: DNA-processing protein DprA [Spirochaetaceae bacterium]|nr:DNA-processing protein DprA [Spirochaetaceae bacterium]
MNNSDRGLLDLIITRLPLKPALQARLCRIFSREEDIIGLSGSDIIEATGGQGLFQFDAERFNIDKARRDAEQDLRIMRARSIQYISIVQAAYPPLLTEIFDPPVVLYYRGKLPPGDQPLLAVVGTRNPPAGSLDWTFRTCRDLGRAGVIVVSGLALGIDAMAHRGTLAGGGKTIAVLGSAVDEIYPLSNRYLARHILETDGALISEYPPGTEPRKWHFPARNRIISGLCRAVLVSHAPLKSGALITADFALEQNRDLWVAGSGAGAGAMRLTEEGAKSIYNAQDVFREWGIKIPDNERTIDSLADNLIQELKL